MKFPGFAQGVILLVSAKSDINCKSTLPANHIIPHHGSIGRDKQWP
jgi:hypothetical protein